MKNRKLILSLLFFSPFIFLIFDYLVFSNEGNSDLKVLEALSLKDGDLVLRRGISIESFAVVMAGTNNAYSHIGLILMEGNKPFVIHIEPGETSRKDDPVRKEPLSSFLGADKASHFAIYRSHLNREKLEKVVVQALEFYFRKCRFDNSYDLQDDQHLYCTELVLKAYRKGDQQMNSLLEKLENVNTLVSNRMILMPGAFTTSNLFYRICDQ